LLYLREHIAAEPLHSVMLGGGFNACDMEVQSPNKMGTTRRILCIVYTVCLYYLRTQWRVEGSYR
jgi:hypothetical protein